MAAMSENCSISEEMEELLTPEVILEEIDDDGESLTFGKSPSPRNFPNSPEAQQHRVAAKVEATPESPVKTRREFGNISPISDLLDEDDIAAVSSDKEEEDEEESESAESTGKVTPEPTHPQSRTSFPRISDGRASPILAYSPSLLKSPSSSSNGKSRLQNSPSTTGSGGGVGKRPRNIARILDNISDHSSGEEEVNTVGVMMAKFTV